MTVTANTAHAKRPALSGCYGQHRTRQEARSKWLLWPTPQACTDQPAPADGSHSGRSCACDRGFVGSGEPGHCSDINACTNNRCDALAVCEDLPAPAPDSLVGRTCTCHNGFEGSGEPGTCHNINACLTSPCDGFATCADLPAPADDTKRGPSDLQSTFVFVCAALFASCLTWVCVFCFVFPPDLFELGCPYHKFTHTHTQTHTHAPPGLFVFRVRVCNSYVGHVASQAACASAARATPAVASRGGASTLTRAPLG